MTTEACLPCSAYYSSVKCWKLARDPVQCKGRHHQRTLFCTRVGPLLRGALGYAGSMHSRCLISERACSIRSSDAGFTRSGNLIHTVNPRTVC